MSLCPACNEKYNPTSALDRAAAELLPKEIELYDFGGGCEIVPKVDSFVEGGTYLSTHMAALVSYGENPKWLGFSLKTATWQMNRADFSDEIAEDLKRAIAAWPTEAVPVTQPLRII